ncbi:MAG: hypothetical protein ACJ79H_07645 [Myxococcales bacterium]
MLTLPAARSTCAAGLAAPCWRALEPVALEFVVEASLLVNEGGVHCTAVVFARPLRTGAQARLGERAFLNGMRVVALDPERAARRGPGLVAFVLEDAMDARQFRPGDRATLESR